MNVKTEICNSFNNHATEYEQAARIQYEIGERLIERLQYLKINPKFVLDVGSGTGQFTQRLKKIYPQAMVIGLDIAFSMLLQGKSKQRWWKKKPILINGDMLSLPFSAGVFDLIFSNQVFHWATTLKSLMGELYRVLNKDGCLMFSTLGPDTFVELKKSWATVDGYAHTNEFADMHDVGDALLKEYFLDPVMDMEKLTVHYKNFGSLVRSLKAQGVRNINPTRNPGLTGKVNWRKFEKSMLTFQTPEGQFPLTYEVVYGHAWKGEEQQTSDGCETYIPITQLQRKLKIET
jgi:malonyl-CoA O-methyltransferase